MEQFDHRDLPRSHVSQPPLVRGSMFCSRCGQMLHVLMTVCVAAAASPTIRLYNSLRQHSMPKCGSEV